MALQSSGTISLANVQSEFGGSNPISMSEYYRGGSEVPNVSINNSIPTSGAISLSNFYGGTNLLPFVSGTHYVSNGSATGSLTSAHGSWSLHNTVWDFQQSGYIWTFTVGSLGTGSLRFRSTADPDPAPRSNSGNDRSLRLYKNGSHVATADAVASNNAVMDRTFSTSGGDVWKLYMYNAMDWRDLGGFERITNIYVTGA